MLSQLITYPADLIESACDGMIEGPKAIYDRAKSIFFRSILDGIGKADAAAEYHFALLNLQRHDAIVPMDEVDTVLQKMIEPVLKQGEEEWGSIII